MTAFCKVGSFSMKELCKFSFIYNQTDSACQKNEKRVTSFGWGSTVLLSLSE